MGYSPWGVQRIRRDRATLSSTYTQPLPKFLPASFVYYLAESCLRVAGLSIF